MGTSVHRHRIRPRPGLPGCGRMARSRSVAKRVWPGWPAMSPCEAPCTNRTVAVTAGLRFPCPAPPRLLSCSDALLRQRRACRARDSNLLELAFLRYPLVGFSCALDPVMEFAGAVGKLANNLIGRSGCHPQRICPAQQNLLADPKPVVRGHARLP